MRTRFIALMLCVVFLCFTTLAQEQKSKQQQLTEAEKNLSESQIKLAEIEARIKELTALIAQSEILKKAIEQQQQTVAQLTDELQAEEEEQAFRESPARTILDVRGLDNYLIDFNGAPRWVMLHGVKAKTYEVPVATLNSYRKKLIKKKVFVRCGDADCGKVYLYELKTSPTLNALLIVNNVALPTDDALFDVAKQMPRSTPTYSSGSTAGSDVSVRGYYRKDGTYVRPHTRSAPGRRR